MIQCDLLKPRWRSLNHLTGSLNHAKKVTSNHLVMVVSMTRHCNYEKKIYIVPQLLNNNDTLPASSKRPFDHQMAATQSLKKSRKTHKKVTRKNLVDGQIFGQVTSYFTKKIQENKWCPKKSFKITHQSPSMTGCHDSSQKKAEDLTQEATPTGNGLYV